VDGLTNATCFDVSIPGAADGDDELGVWRFPGGLDAIVDIGEAFGFLAPARGAVDTMVVSLWQVTLPASISLANQELAQRFALLQCAEQALPEATGRLAAFIRQGGPTEERAFGPPKVAVALPERELARWITEVGQEASFGMRERRFADRQGDVGAAAAFLEKVHRALRYLALVETRGGDRRLALTVVSWAGDYQTAWCAGLERVAADQHTRVVALALRSRDAWLRMALLVLRGGIQLGILFPANPILAIPAAYRFVKQVLAEAQKLQAALQYPRQIPLKGIPKGELPWQTNPRPKARNRLSATP
jgi:hypothetical protein